MTPRPTVDIDKLHVPIPLALGLLEYLSNEELYDHLNDVLAELKRRADSYVIPE